MNERGILQKNKIALIKKLQSQFYSSNPENIFPGRVEHII
jgi:hypothetical protein